MTSEEEWDALRDDLARSRGPRAPAPSAPAPVPGVPARPARPAKRPPANPPFGSGIVAKAMILLLFAGAIVAYPRVFAITGIVLVVFVIPVVLVMAAGKGKNAPKGKP